MNFSLFILRCLPYLYNLAEIEELLVRCDGMGMCGS